MSSIAYRPEIDGLRAIAVIPVVLFHLNSTYLPGGFIGVDVFFVISGFLITSLILNEYKLGVFSFSNFWLRRIRRILPALTAMVLMTLVVGRTILYAPDINNLGYQGMASLLSFANISHWLIAGDYWGQEAVSSPLLHTWSLSVEEQFYFLFPLLLVIILKYFHKWAVLSIFILSLSSVLLYFYGTQRYSISTFYLLPTRAWELGVGVLLAILSFGKHLGYNKYHTLAAIIGFTSVLLSYFFSGGGDGVSPFLVIPVFGAALIITFTKDTDNIISRVLSVPPVVYVGKISYSLYLWHWPTLVLTKQLSLRQNTEINSVFVLAIIFTMAVLSYHFIEVPTRRNKKIVPYILSILLAGVAFSYGLMKISDPSENTSCYNKTEWDGPLYSVDPKREWPEAIKKKMTGITIPNNNSVDANACSNGGIKRLYGEKTPKILVLGDSHALMWAKVLDDAAKELETSIAFYSASGTGTFLLNIPPKRKQKGLLFFTADEKYELDVARLKYLDEWKPRVVVIVCNWSNIRDMQEISDLIEYIGSIGSRVLFIEQPPMLFFGNKNAPQYLSYLGLTPSGNSKQYIHYLNSLKYQKGIQLVKQLTDKYVFCQRVAISDLFLANGKVWVIDSKDVLYIDDDHLSYSGALKAKDRIVVALQEQLTREH